MLSIEHSENKIVMYFENEVGPGVLQSSVQQTCNLQKFHITRAESTNKQFIVVCASDILPALVFLECQTKALQARSHSQTAQIA